MEADDDEHVEDGEGDDGAEAEERLARPQVHPVERVGRHAGVGLRLERVALLLALRLLPFAVRHHVVLEGERDVEEGAAHEGAEDGQVGVAEGVDALELSRLVDGDVPVHRHADDDVHGRGHEAGIFRTIEGGNITDGEEKNI